MAILSTRKKAFICNLLISFLCLLSIVSYFILPFWKVQASYTLTAETIEKLLSDAVEKEAGDEESESDGGNPLSNLDFSEIIDGDITIPISITLQTQDILSSLSTDPAILVKNILSDNINNLVDELTPVINKTAKNLVKTLAKTVLSEQLKEQVKESLGDDVTDEELTQELEKLGVSEEYVNNQIDNLIDTLYQEGTTTDSAADAIIDAVEDTLLEMEKNGGENLNLDEETKATLKEEIKDLLSQFADENGNLNFDELTTSLLLGFLTKDSEDGDGDGDAEPAVMLMRADLNNQEGNDDLDKEAEDLSAELKAELTNRLMNILDDSTLNTIAEAIKIISYVVLFTFFTWAYLVLKILLKMGMKVNTIKLGLPIWFGSLPCWILFILPTAVFNALLTPTGPLASMVGESTMGVLGNLSVSFFSCSVVSFLIGIFFVLFVIFYYGKLRRTLKKMKRGLIPDDSIPVAVPVVAPVATPVEAEIATVTPTEEPTVAPVEEQPSKE